MIAQVTDLLLELDAQNREVALKALRQLHNTGFLGIWVQTARDRVVGSARQLANDPNNGDQIVRVSIAAEQVYAFAEQVEQILVESSAK